MEQHDLVYKIYNENINLVNEIIGNSELTNTFKALKRFHFKVEELTSSLELIAENNLFYPSQCIARVLYEHFIVGYYIFTKCRVDKSDECATDYYEYYDLFELMKQTNYNSKLDNSFDPKISTLENFFAKAPMFRNQNISENDYQEINRRSNKFDIRKILRFIQEDLDKGDFYQQTEPFVFAICREYNRVSSYVHGRPTAELTAYDNIPNIDKTEAMRRYIKFGKIMSCQMLIFIMTLLLIEDERFAEKYIPLHEFMENDLNIDSGNDK